MKFDIYFKTKFCSDCGYKCVDADQFNDGLIGRVHPLYFSSASGKFELMRCIGYHHQFSVDNYDKVDVNRLRSEGLSFIDEMYTLDVFPESMRNALSSLNESLGLDFNDFSFFDEANSVQLIVSKLKSNLTPADAVSIDLTMSLCKECGGDCCKLYDTKDDPCPKPKRDGWFKKREHCTRDRISLCSEYPVDYSDGVFSVDFCTMLPYKELLPELNDLMPILNHVIDHVDHFEHHGPKVDLVIKKVHLSVFPELSLENTLNFIKH